MQFLDINGVRRFKRYTDDTFITSEEVSEVEDATLENFYTKAEIDEMISDLESEIGSGGGSSGSGEENIIEAITFNGVSATIDNTTKTAAITASIPTVESLTTNEIDSIWTNAT